MAFTTITLDELDNINAPGASERRKKIRKQGFAELERLRSELGDFIELSSSYWSGPTLHGGLSGTEDVSKSCFERLLEEFDAFGRAVLRLYPWNKPSGWSVAEEVDSAASKLDPSWTPSGRENRLWYDRRLDRVKPHVDLRRPAFDLIFAISDLRWALNEGDGRRAAGAGFGIAQALGELALNLEHGPDLYLGAHTRLERSAMGQARAKAIDPRAYPKRLARAAELLKAGQGKWELSRRIAREEGPGSKADTVYRYLRRKKVI